MGRRAEDARPVALAETGKRGMRAQFGALCWRRRKDRLEVLLVTGRGNGRWMVPKGWPMEGHSPARAAAVEAREEAGVTGRASERCLGMFTYAKSTPEGPLPVAVAVFAIEVTGRTEDWPERKARRRRWVTLPRAAKLVAEPDLARLLRDPGLPDLLR